jgi:lysylphosphatidylglycerol synthetase-like protein (DUF2156 family)
VTRPPVRLMASPLLVAGLLDLLGAGSAAPPAWLDHADSLLDGGGLGRGETALFGVILLLVAGGLGGHRRLAHHTLAAFLTWDLLATSLDGQHALRLALLAVALLGLYRTRSWFRVMPDLERVRARPAAAAGIAAIVVCGSVVPPLELVALNLREPSGPLWGGLARGLAADAWPLPAVVPAIPWIPSTLSLLGTVALVVALGVLLLPASAPPAASEAERCEVARLVGHPDSGTLAPFALRADKAYVFSPDHRAAIGYRVLLGVAVAGGDPVGAAGAHAAAVAEFLALCIRRGWRPMAIGVRSDRLAPWTAGGLRSLPIGDEVLLDVGDFTLTAPGMRSVRKAVNRTRNAGVTTEIHREDHLDHGLRVELGGVLDSWLRGRRYHGFSMSLDGMLDGRHPDCLVVVARDRARHAVAFQRYALCRGGRALSLDAMPRHPRSPNGVNERMIADLVAHARERGIEEVSLNFASFRRLLEEGRSGTLAERLGYRLTHALDPLIMVESLYRFDARFHPRWLGRSVVLGSWLGLGWYAAAAMGLEFALPYDRRRADRRAHRPDRWDG